MAEPARVAAGPRIREWARRNRTDDWMAARWVALARHYEDAGLEVAQERGFASRFLEGLMHAPPAYVRVNPLRITPRELQKRLDARGFRLAASDLDPNVLRVRDAPISVGATQEHLLGMTTPQDVSSASAALALGARPGETVADLAAAPGVKTLHVAGDMRDDGLLVAAEPDEARLRALRFNLERGGVSCAAWHHSTAQDLPGEAWADRVLLDAPCTGEGTLPKDRKRRRGRLDEIARLSDLQQELLEAADRVLRPGGVLVYATCTFAPEENEAQVQMMLDAGYTMEALPFDRCGGVPLLPGVTAWPGLELSEEVSLARRFLPGVHPSLGFFVARLRKPEDADARSGGGPDGGPPEPAAGTGEPGAGVAA